MLQLNPRHEASHSLRSPLPSGVAFSGLPVMTTIAPSLAISTRATLNPAATTAFVARVTSRFLNKQGPRIGGTYQNIGRSPAVDVKIGVGPAAIPLTAPLKSTEIWPETPFWKLTEASLQEKCIGNEPMIGSAVVYPSNRIEGSVEKEMTGTWNPAVKAAVLAANQIVIVAGCFTYQTMNRTFHTGFCKYFYPLIGKPSTTWPAKSCPVGNFDK